MRNIIFNFFLILILPFFLYSCTTGKAKEIEANKPNFVFILADDLGWTSTSFLMDEQVHSSKSDYFETPNLARLAKKGMRFTNAYAPAAICSPTRRSLQLGQTPARQGEEDFEARYFPFKEKLFSIPRVLKSVDSHYKTAHYGKWDIRGGIFPEDIGYDESDGNTGNGAGNVFRHKSEKWTEAFLRNDPKKIESLTSRGLNFMERQHKAGNPFYLQISHYATHVDMQCLEETYKKYVKKKKGEIHNTPQFAGMLENMDTGIGKLLDKIEELGIADNTYIFFTTDNGAVPFIAPNKEKLEHPSTYSKPGRNSPLRGGKWTLYEGGIRVPFIAAGPAIPAGEQTDVPIAGWDLLPSIAHLAGFAGELPRNLDGGSIHEVLSGDKQGSVKRPAESFVFHRFSKGYPHSVIRKGKFKLLKYWKEGEFELYDLVSDIGELEDISDKNPQQVEALHRELMSYLKEVDAEILKEFSEVVSGK